MPVRIPTLVLAALSVVALVQAPSAAFAQGAIATEVVVRPPHPTPDENTPSEKVSYADLDIGQSAGAHALLARIKAAANHVCAAEKGDLPCNGAYQSCLDTAVSNAVHDVGSPTLSDLFGQGG